MTGIWLAALDVLSVWFASRKTLFRHARILERRLACAQEEILSLRRQRDAALDMVDRNAWAARHEMAVHKAGAEQLRLAGPQT
jgi:hypothetical protein